jgi:hypothetical protein
MNRKSHIEVYKLRSLEKSETAPKITLLSMNVNKNMYEYVANIDGFYGLFYGTPNPIHETCIVSFYFNLPSDQKGSRYIWNYELPVATDEYLLWLGEKSDEAGLTVRDYKNNAEIIRLLQGHRQVIWKNGEENNINKNIKSDIVSFELLNTTAATIVKSKIEDIAVEAAYQLKQWRENDHQTYMNFCYLWGLQNIEKFSKEELSNIITHSAKSNVKKYTQVLGWISDEIRVNVSKGMATLAKDSKKALIANENNYFTFNAELVGANQEEVVTYFKTHPQSYKLLKNLLEVKENIEVEVESEPKVNLNPVSQNPTLISREQEKEKEKFLTQIGTKLQQVKDGKNLMADKNDKGHYTIIDEVTTTTEDVVMHLAKTEMVVKYGLQSEYWKKAFELKLTKTLQG